MTSAGVRNSRSSYRTRPCEPYRYRYHLANSVIAWLACVSSSFCRLQSPDRLSRYASDDLLLSVGAMHPSSTSAIHRCLGSLGTPRIPAGSSYVVGLLLCVSSRATASICCPSSFELTPRLRSGSPIGLGIDVDPLALLAIALAMLQLRVNSTDNSKASKSALLADSTGLLRGG